VGKIWVGLYSRPWESSVYNEIKLQRWVNNENECVMSHAEYNWIHVL